MAVEQTKGEADQSLFSWIQINRRYFTTFPGILKIIELVVLIFGIMGALRVDELINIQTSHISEHDGIYLVKIPETKTKKPKSFTIDGHYFNLVKQYRSLRQQRTPTTRFFVNYQKKKCTVQPIGRNKLAAMPKLIAEYLNLPNAELYTGHSFRRTSTTLLANAGADMDTIKRHGAWKSSAVAESYIEDSLHYKKRTGKMIESVINLPFTSSDKQETVSATNLPSTSSANQETVYEQPTGSSKSSSNNVIGVICMFLALPAVHNTTQWFLYVTMICFVVTVIWSFIYLLSAREAVTFPINWSLTEMLNTCFLALIILIASIFQISHWAGAHGTSGRWSNIFAGIFGVANCFFYTISSCSSYVDWRQLPDDNP